MTRLTSDTTSILLPDTSVNTPSKTLSVDSKIKSLNFKNPAVWLRALTESSHFSKGTFDFNEYEKF